jgi:hypothetical protein
VILQRLGEEVTGYDGIPAEFWKIFCIRRDGIEALTNIFNNIRNGEEFPLDRKFGIIYPIYNGKRSREETRNYWGISFSRVFVCGRIFSGIPAGGLRH